MLQGSEIFVILLLALIVLGPKRLPDLARKLGTWTTELRTAAREITAGLQTEVDDLKQVGDDLKQVGDELKAPIEELKQPLKDAQDDLKSADPRSLEWTGPKPISGPTPEDAMADLEQIRAAGEEE